MGKAIWTFEDRMVQIPALSLNGVQMPYPIVGFICQMPLLKSSRRQLQSSALIKLANTACDNVCDDALYKTQL